MGGEIGFGSDETTLEIGNYKDQQDFSIFEARAQIYYILNPTRRVNHYLSIEPFYFSQNSVIEFDRYESNNRTIRYDRADYQREKIGANLLYGVFIPFSKYVGVNFYVGLGVRSRTNTYKNVFVSEIIDFYYYDDDSFLFDLDDYREREGTTTGLNISAGCKFFFILD